MEENGLYAKIYYAGICHFNARTKTHKARTEGTDPFGDSTDELSEKEVNWFVAANDEAALHFKKRKINALIEDSTKAHAGTNTYGELLETVVAAVKKYTSSS